MAAPENGIIASILSGVSVIGLLGYLGHSVFTKLDKKVDRDVCADFRKSEKELMDRMDRDIQRVEGGLK
jgi:hypothetical protein